MENERKMYQDMERIFFTKEQIAEAVKKLGQRITEDYAGKAPVMVCILKGASLFFADLIREIDLPLTIDFMVVSSYGASTVSSGEVRLIKDLDRSIMGKDVILVEDIVDTGMTLKYLKRLLYSRGANSMKIATLLDKTGALQSLLSGISAAGASVVTITQSRPENGTAQVEVTVRTGTMQMTVEEMLTRLARQSFVVEVHRGT